MDILVVDDDTILLELITQLFELHGLSCETAKDGFEALEKIKQHFYSIVISDIRMPKLTGTELLQEIRNLQSASEHKTKVILMTAYSTAEIQEKSMTLGADEFIIKPFDIKDFMDKFYQVAGNNPNH
ncbi:MAG: response regulator [Candidatus Aureabacteria bacterium]|nr:response regulator [Candidatus Auribacterota bacterium]